MAKKSKRPCCNCMKCKCRCHKEDEGFLGRVVLKFFKYPDDTHEVKLTFSRYDDLPDPDQDKRGFTVMGLIAAQVQDYAKKQMQAVDMLIVGKQEMQTIMKAQADVDKYQQPLPFDEEDKDSD